MRKNKSFLALSALGVIALILMVAAGVLLSGQRAVSFRADGYVLDTAKQDDDTLEVVTDHFPPMAVMPSAFMEEVIQRITSVISHPWDMNMPTKIRLRWMIPISGI